MNRRKLSAGLVVGAMALVGLGVSGGVASAAPKALPVESTFTLPLPVPLAVTVETGPGGAITDVSVNPATAITATEARPKKVAFTVDTTGVKVSVKSKGQTQSVSARAGALKDISGPGGWSGDVFGDGGTPEVVAFIVGGTDTAPTIEITNPGGGVPSATEVKTDDDDGDEVSARASILFTNKTTFQTRTLSIRVKVENESDDDDDDDSPETSASVRITLGKLRGLAGVPAGDKTWTGLLCNGTTGTITYTVATDGSISNVKASVLDARIDVEGNKADVRFSKDERVKIRVSVDPTTGLTINVDERIRCRDAEDPTVNGAVVPTTDDSDDDDDSGDDHGGDHQGGDDQGGDSHGGGHGGDDKKSDD